MKKEDFEQRLLNLDTGLFERIESQTNVDDKTSLLAVQNAVRFFKRDYVYLEIGSHLGGSIQPHLLDPRCKRIYSVDKRPLVQADERYPEGCRYSENSTERMLYNLSQVQGGDLRKLICFDSDASEVNINLVAPKPDLCFIDGEHTHQKVVDDFKFCRSVLSDNGVIVFHDAHILTKGIDLIVKSLREERARFAAYYLPSHIFILDFTQNRLRINGLPAGKKYYYRPPWQRNIANKTPRLLRGAIRLLLRVLRSIRSE